MEIEDIASLSKGVTDYLVESIKYLTPLTNIPKPTLDNVLGYCIKAIKSFKPGRRGPLTLRAKPENVDITPLVGGRTCAAITQELFSVENLRVRDYFHGVISEAEYIPLCFIVVSASIVEKDNEKVVNFEEKVHFCRKDASKMSRRNYDCIGDICNHDEFQYNIDDDLNDFCFAINDIVKQPGTSGIIFRLRHLNSMSDVINNVIILDKMYLTINDLNIAIANPVLFKVIEKFGLKTMEQFDSYIHTLFAGSIGDILNGSILSFKHNKDTDIVVPDIIRPIDKNQIGNLEKPKFLGEKMGVIANNEIPLAPITIPGKVDVIINHLQDGISSLVGNGYAYRGIKGMMKSVKELLKNEDFVMKIAEVCVDIDNATEEGLYGIDDMYSKSYNRFFFDAVIDYGSVTGPYRIKRVDVTRPIDDRLLDILSDKQKIFVGLKLEEVAVPFGKSQTAQRLSLVIRNESLEARKELKFLTHLRLSKYIVNIRGEGNVNI